MKYLWKLALGLCLFASAAFGQAVQQSNINPLVPGHIGLWIAPGVLADGNGALGGPQGTTPTEIGLTVPVGTGNAPWAASGTGPNGENFCNWSGPVGGPRQYICLSPNLGNNTAFITVGQTGGATPPGLVVDVNGTKIPFPGPGSGTVVGPGSSVNGDLASFNGTSGQILADSGILTSSVLTQSAAAALYAPLISPALTGTPTAPTPITSDNSTKIATTAYVKNQGYLTSLTTLWAPQGRLTLSSHTPVMVATVSGATSIFYDAYVGDLVPVFNGTVDVILPILNNEISDGLPSSGSGVVNNGGVFDEWGINNGGSLTLCHATNGAGGGWNADTGGSNTARGTGYTQINHSTRAYITNTNQIPNCYNGGTQFGPIAVNQATYFGTFATTAAGQVSYSLGGSASGGTAGTLYLYNYYNRVASLANVIDTGTSYTYSLNTPRQARASAGNQVSFVLGVQEDPVTAVYSSRVSLLNVALAFINAGLGLDTTTAFSVQPSLLQNPTSAGAMGGAIINTTKFSVGVGLHTVAALESGDSSNGNSFDQGNANFLNVSVQN